MRTVVDCTTGRTEVRLLTEDEQAQLEADVAAADAKARAEADEQARLEADEQAWRDAVSNASSIADIKTLLLGSNTPVRPVVGRKPR